jgi:tetratricopeptide (TPR) repeat protein
LQLSPRHLFLPTTLLVVFLLRWKLALPWWGLAAILSVLPVYYFVLPRLIKRQERELERGLLRLLQQGRKNELLELYRRQTLLRLLGPADRVQRRLGFIYFELGDYERARACYARAAQTASAGDRLAILMGLAASRYRGGDYEGAEVVYRELLRRGQKLPEVHGGLAHALLLRGSEVGEALRHATAAVEASSDGPQAAALKLTLAEALLATNKAGKARRVLGGVEVGAGDAWLEARRAWVLAKLAVHDDRLGEARELFEDVWRLDEGGGLGDLARTRLAELDGEVAPGRAAVAAG